MLRYKLTCPQTWPNPRGSDRDATEAILKAHGLNDDATFGNTKVFIQNPVTVFELEKIRDSKIPGLVIYLQKLVRGALARRLAKRMRAAYKIGLFYRRSKYQKLFRTLQHSYKYDDLYPCSKFRDCFIDRIFFLLGT